MNLFGVFANRFAQAFLRLGMAFLRIPMPSCRPSVAEIPSLLSQAGKKKPLLVTGADLAQLGFVTRVLAPLKEAGIEPVVFSGAVANPTFACIEEGYALYAKEGCDCLIALGGGSAMDAAKGIGIRAAYPQKDLSHFKGVLKIHKKIPLLLAIPTTAGTGSECTLAAVVVNEKTHDKFQIDSPHLVPSYAILDPSFVVGLPPKLIASTGMDALTHAVEAYIGRSNTAFTKQEAIKAVQLIHDNLVGFYQNPYDAKKAQAMQEAAYHAGAAFTRAYVGYVHALAHALGGYYGLPHGYANAVILPHVLDFYGAKDEKKLAALAATIGLPGEGERAKANAFIAWIRAMNQSLDIPASFGGVVKHGDYAELARHAAKEGNPLYPVPRLADRKQLEALLREVDA